MPADDHPMLRTGVKQLVSMAPDITVVGEASNGEQGIELAESLDPDLILLDLNMPGMNGFQATRQITRHPETSSIPVVIVSTKDQETDRVWGKRQGASDYLTKPVDETNLLRVINQLLISG